MDIQNARYESQDGYPILAMDVDGIPARLLSEAKPTTLRHGLVFLGNAFEAIVPPVELATTTLRGFTRDRGVFRLYLTFGLEVFNDRFQVGPARAQPDPEEVRLMGTLLEPYATPGAPTWAELTAF